MCEKGIRRLTRWLRIDFCSRFVSRANIINGLTAEYWPLHHRIETDKEIFPRLRLFIAVNNFIFTPNACAFYENIEWKKDGNFTVNLTIVSFKILSMVYILRSVTRQSSWLLSNGSFIIRPYIIILRIITENADKHYENAYDKKQEKR